MECKRIDIIVPCYNEEQNIEAFYEAVQAAAAHIEESSEFACSYDFSYIFIDDFFQQKLRQRSSHVRRTEGFRQRDQRRQTE